MRTRSSCLMGFVLVAVLGAGMSGAAAEAEAAPGPVGLFLPDNLYAVPGIETSVYFDNAVLVLDPKDYAFDVTCEKGTQQDERWVFTPEDADVGRHPLTLEVRNGADEVIARAASTVVVSPRNALENKGLSALLIGDSLTHASVYSQHLLDLCGMPGNPALTLIGTHVPDEAKPLNRHEGYGGWTAERFVAYYTGVARGGEYAKRGSPFLYLNKAGQPELDFERYCQEVSGGKHPAVVTIFLGCNDTFAATDETIASVAAGMFEHLDRLVAAIHAASPETRVGLIAPVPPSASQDAFGAAYKNGQTRWQYRRNQHAVVKAMYERYGEAPKYPGVSLIPAFLSLDCVHNYPVRAVPWNSRTGQEAARQSDGVHPSAEGYRQIGDAVYCWMKSE